MWADGMLWVKLWDLNEILCSEKPSLPGTIPRCYVSWYSYWWFWYCCSVLVVSGPHGKVQNILPTYGCPQVCCSCVFMSFCQFPFDLSGDLRDGEIRLDRGLSSVHKQDGCLYAWSVRGAVFTGSLWTVCNSSLSSFPSGWTEESALSLRLLETLVCFR